MVNMKDLKIIEFLLEDDDKISGDIDLISIVQNPATELNFQLFSKNNIRYNFTETSDMKIVTGCIMKPNLKILRYDNENEPYYCYFSESTVRLASQLYFKNKNNHKTNLDHSTYEIDKGVYLFESWIVEDSEKDKATVLGFKNVEKGDWYGSFKIEDDSLWKLIKNHYNNGTAGFSIEGLFVLNEDLFKKIEIDTDKETYLKINSILNDSNFDIRTKYNEIKKLLTK